MNTNGSNTNLIIGLAAIGLALVVTGVELYRRRRAGRAADPEQSDLLVEPDSSVEDLSPGVGLPDGREPPANLPAHALQQELPLDYFVLVFALTIPFYLFGGSQLPVPMQLPASALAWANPLLAAAILSYRRDRKTGLRQLFKKVLDYPKIKNRFWYLPILLLNPLIMVLSYAVMRLAKLPLPQPQIPWLMAPVLFMVFFIAAIGEELGWMGYAYDPMQDRWGALKASLVLGLLWALIHIIPDVQNGHTANWILWHRLGTIATRVLIVWLYNHNGKSVFAAVLFHAMNNLSWALFPNYGSHYDPFVTGLITILAAGMVIFGFRSNGSRPVSHAVAFRA